MIRRRRRWMAMAIAALGAVGCGKKDAPPNPEPHASASTTQAASAAPSAAASSAPPASAKAGGGVFKGKYAIKPAAMYVPADKDWANVKWKNEETTHVGEGQLSLEIDSLGRVTGTTENVGALGSAIIEGTSDGKTVAGTLRRKDASDEGLTGTLVGTITADAIEGTMRLSNATANAVREATFSAKK